MKKNKFVPLLALLAVLCLLVAAYLLVLNLTKEDSSDTDPEAEAIALSTYSPDDVETMTYTLDGAEVVLARSGDKWVIPEDEKLPLDSTAIEEMVSIAVTLTANRSVEGGELETYGLDEPSFTLTLEYADGESDVFELGDENSFNGNTYLLFKDAVYMIEDTLTDTFCYTAEELVLIEDSFPSEITSDGMTSVSITGENGETNVIEDEDGLSELYTILKSAFAFQNYRGYGLDADGLAEYGITGDGAEVKISYKTSAETGENAVQLDGSFAVIFGRDEDGNVYYATPGGTMTYRMSDSEFETIMEYLEYTAPEETEAETEGETE